MSEDKKPRFPRSVSVTMDEYEHVQRHYNTFSGGVAELIRQDMERKRQGRVNARKRRKAATK